MKTGTLCYKLTDQNAQTKNATQWGENVTHTAPGTGQLCSAGWLHAYTDPLLAVLLNPIHADFKHPRLWEALGDGARKDDHGLKIGFAKLTTIKELPLPGITMTQRIAFRILCALEFEKNPGWRKWAQAWLDGSDRSRADYAAPGRRHQRRAAAEKPLDLIAIARKAMEIK